MKPGNVPFTFLLRWQILLLALCLSGCNNTSRQTASNQSPDSSGTLSTDVLKEIPSPAAAGAGQPQLIETKSGKLILSWLEKTGENRTSLKFAARRAGENWSQAKTIAEGDNFFVNWADFPSVAELTDGRLAAHWLVKSGAKPYAYDIFISFSSDGGNTWSTPFKPHTDNTQTEHGFVSLVPLPDGRLGAIWLDGRKFEEKQHARFGGAEIVKIRHGNEHETKNEMTLRYAAISADGKLSEETELDGRVCDCCQTAAALTSNGVVVVYRDRSTEEMRDFSVVRFAGGKWSEPTVLNDDGWKIQACPVNGASIAADGRRVVVAWFTSGADNKPRVKLSFSENAGETFAPPIIVGDVQNQGRVDVVLLKDNSALVSWLGGNQEGAVIKVRRVRADGKMDEIVDAASLSGARSTGFPRLERVGEETVLAWTENKEPSRVRTALLKF